MCDLPLIVVVLKAVFMLSVCFSLEAMCQNYVTMLGGTEGFRSEQGDIVLVARIIGIASKVAPFITSEDQLSSVNKKINIYI